MSMSMDSLWGEAFEVESASPQTLITKINNPKKATTVKKTKKSSISVEDKLRVISENVYRILGSFASNTVVLRNIDEFKKYIDVAILNGEIALDTETDNSLNPITCKLMGLCLYTPGMKNAYIPVNHTDLNGNRLDWQVTEKDVFNELSRLKGVKIIGHNLKFDYQVIKCTTGYKMEMYWDTLIGSRILNENERASLKKQYIDKIDSSIEKYDIEHLFEGLPYAIVNPSLFALYAATDAYMTYRLYKWQLEQFEMTSNASVYKLFRDIEMPVVEVTAEMELTGIEIDFEYAERLSKKYHKKLDEVSLKIAKELSNYDSIIEKWKFSTEANKHPDKLDKSGKVVGYGKSKKEQLSNPINVDSPVQLAILLFDILGIKNPVPSKDKSENRGTGEDVLSLIDLPLCKLILEQRGINKLIGTYIDKLPAQVCEKDNRLHAHFNQIGADTGRFSSSDPNLQNIPSHEKSIRMMFKATDGYKLVGSDFSAQEPRLLAHYSKDENMITAFKECRDIYASIGVFVYDNDYWDNMEFTDSTKTVKNVEGAKRRSACKQIILGLMYGRGVESVAEQIGKSKKEAEEIINKFFDNFPNVKKWIDDTNNNAKKNGYVEDYYGRRRRLPDLFLPKYEVTLKGKSNSLTKFNPLLGSKLLITGKTSPLIEKYENKINNMTERRGIKNLIEQASKEGVIIKDNSNKIAQAERQCVNARVQGGAATMSKKAMMRVHNDKILNELGFRLLIAVHDELIGECPEENADKAAERLSEVMISAAAEDVIVPMSCDADISSVWYEESYNAEIKKEYNNLLKTLDKESAKNVIIENHIETLPEKLIEIIS